MFIFFFKQKTAYDMRISDWSSNVCSSDLRLTAWPSLKTDVRNAGGDWVDEEVVVDHQLVTSRKPDDIPAFNEAMIGLFAQNKQSSNAERKCVGKGKSV